MIKANIRILDDEYDWFGDCEFPVLPPIGAHISIIDKNANMRDLAVEDIIIQGVRSESRKELASLYGDLSIVIVCTKAHKRS